MNEEYEAAFIIKDYEDSEKMVSIMKKIDEIVVTEGFEIERRRVYSAKRFAYEIEKEKRGYYYVLKFKDNCKKKNAKAKVEKNINTMEEVLKLIIIKCES